ncbi:hypothetical protein [Ferrovibrio sp.]|uniref:hypothetical protein n=1 Tax=Ferrovibrio sp. TaxID=1917215 RepID=UPI000CAC8D17|nr:hypothetical protein [Ferrovibrio sp.]PJI42110.1 MAG: hypothetical protein CTR53_06615 [Ferrovibrio sp.]
MTESHDTSVEKSETANETVVGINHAIGLAIVVIGFLSWPVMLFSAGMTHNGGPVLLAAIIQPWINLFLMKMIIRLGKREPFTQQLILIGYACLICGSLLAAFVEPIYAAAPIGWLVALAFLLI